MGRTCQLKWGKPAANALRARYVSRGRRSLHRSADDETNVAALGWTNSVRRKETVWAASERRTLSEQTRSNTAATQWCYGNQCWLWNEVQKNWCVTIATASFQHKLSVPSTHVPLLYFTHTMFAVSSNIRSICSVLSADSILQAKAVQHRKHKHRWPTAQRTLTDKHRPTLDRRAS